MDFAFEASFPSMGSAAGMEMDRSAQHKRVKQGVDTLKREQACDQCRARKIRCDAGQPSCTACRRHAKHLGQNPATIVCNYRPTRGSRGGGDRSKGDERTQSTAQKTIEAQAAKIAQLETLIAERVREGMHPAGRSARDFTNANNEAGSSTSAQYATSSTGSFSPPGDAFQSTTPLLGASDPVNGPPTAFTNPFGGDPLSAEPGLDGVMRGMSRSNSHVAMGSRVGSMGGEAGDFGGGGMTSSGSGSGGTPAWASTLPHPSIVVALVSHFVRKNVLLQFPVGRFSGNIVEKLALPPNHPEFPHLSIIHTMCCIAAPFNNTDMSSVGIAPDDTHADYWKPYPSPAAYHLAMALAHAESALEEGQDLLSLLQTYLLLTSAAFARTKFIQGWHFLGRAQSLIEPLRLSLDDRARGSLRTGQSADKAVVQSDQDRWTDLTERRAVFWTLVKLDSLMKLGGGWEGMIREEDVTTLLPGPIHTKQDAYHESLSFRSPSFFTTHIDSPWLGWQINTKSSFLAGRVSAVLQLLPSGTPTDGDPQGLWPQYQSLAQSESFLRLSSEIRSLHTTMPRPYTAGAPLDLYLITGYIVCNVAILFMFEPFVTRHPDCTAARRCIEAATRVTDLFGEIWDKGETGYPGYAVSIKAVARCLMRDLAIKSWRGDYHGADFRRQQVEYLLVILRRIGTEWPVGEFYAHLITNSLQTAAKTDLVPDLPRIAFRDEGADYGAPMQRIDHRWNPVDITHNMPNVWGSVPASMPPLGSTMPADFSPTINLQDMSSMGLPPSLSTLPASMSMGGMPTNGMSDNSNYANFPTLTSHSTLPGLPDFLSAMSENMSSMNHFTPMSNADTSYLYAQGPPGGNPSGM